VWRVSSSPGGSSRPAAVVLSCRDGAPADQILERPGARSRITNPKEEMKGRYYLPVEEIALLKSAANVRSTGGRSRNPSNPHQKPRESVYSACVSNATPKRPRWHVGC
jgi:hypothetical protein